MEGIIPCGNVLKNEVTRFRIDSFDPVQSVGLYIDHRALGRLTEIDRSGDSADRVEKSNSPIGQTAFCGAAPEHHSFALGLIENFNDVISGVDIGNGELSERIGGRIDY